jgi:hypothetical protein
MSMHKSVRLVGALLLVISLNFVVEAQRYGQRYNQSRQRWEYLGQSNVDGRSDRDQIRINRPGAFRAIQLQVQGGAIEFNRVVVHFENGADTEVSVRERIPAGGKTRAIDLPGDQRRIQSVEVWYENGNWGRRRPNLRVYGLR